MYPAAAVEPLNETHVALDLLKDNYEISMLKKPGGVLRSKKVVGFLWLLAGLLMFIPPILRDGNRTFIGIGVMFLIFGIVALARERKT